MRKNFLSRRQEKIYREMRWNAIKGFEEFGHWNWTMTQYWTEDEKCFDFPRILRFVESKKNRLKFDLEIKIIDAEYFEKETQILNQIEKFCYERIKRLVDTYPQLKKHLK